MRKLILFFCVCIFVACNGGNKSSSVTDTTYTSKDTLATTDSVPSAITTPNSTSLKLIESKWILKTATVSPQMTRNGKTSTNFIELSGNDSCIANDYTFVFLENGIYQNFAGGANCNLFANGDDQKWSLNGNTIILKNQYGSSNPFIFNGNSITQTGTTVVKNVTYTISYTYLPVKIK